jgi:hypothetical protein
MVIISYFRHKNNDCGGKLFYPPPQRGGMHSIWALRLHMQVVGLCPTPHKLFEKSLSKNFTKVVF